jgi:hypothetical protein
VDAAGAAVTKLLSQYSLELLNQRDVSVGAVSILRTKVSYERALRSNFTVSFYSDPYYLGKCTGFLLSPVVSRPKGPKQAGRRRGYRKKVFFFLLEAGK